MTLLVASPTELSTAATDFILAILAGAAFLGVRHTPSPPGGRNLLWQAIFVGLALSSLLGAVAHGIRMAPWLNKLLWHPLYFFLGLTLTLLAALAIHDLRGGPAARRFLPWLLPLPLMIVAITTMLGGAFIYFILFEAVVMLFALAVYSRLYLKQSMPGSGLILAGIIISMVAALAQAAGPYTFQALFLFDHNGAFHLVQMVGVICFYRGAIKG